jgi:hypothetical protein
VISKIIHEVVSFRNLKTKDSYKPPPAKKMEVDPKLELEGGRKRRSPKPLGPCNSGEVRDPKTRRCRERKSSAGRPYGSQDRKTRKRKSPRRSPCPSGEIRDKESKRCRAKLRSARRSPCLNSQTRDPVTKHCREKRKPGPKKGSARKVQTWSAEHPGNAPCPPGQTRDKDTKRCRNKKSPGRPRV